MPEAHQPGLLHQLVRVLAQVLHDSGGGRAAVGGLRLARHQQRVHERLRVVAADADEEAVDQPLDDHLIGVDPRNHLKNPALLCQ